MLPCKFGNGKEDEEDDGGNNRRKLLSLAENDIWRRVLAPAKEEYCSKYVSKACHNFNFTIKYREKLIIHDLIC